MMKTIIDRSTLGSVTAASPDNLILIDKPEDWTSFDVVKKVKGIGRFKKVGHGGTLDPFATGLLILGSGKMTRQLQNVSNAVKTYEATIQFGQSTDTYDRTGTIVQDAALSAIDNELVENTVKSYLGDSLQVPPMYSAKKVNGVRLYKMARKGKEVERKPNPITIFEIDVLQFGALSVDLRIVCSKGTYIRTLAHDIGEKCGYHAFLSALRRTQIGDYALQQAVSISEFEAFWKTLREVDASIPGA